MNSKVKGLLKGLRYISQIFENFLLPLPNLESNTAEEAEAEMQIGYPTDVKHVAHIGWDGSSNGNPSWMNEFRNAPLSSLGAEAMGEISRSDSDNNPRIVQGSPLCDSRMAIVESTSHPLPEPLPLKPSRCDSSSGSSTENTGSRFESTPSAPKQSRRNKSSSEVASTQLDSSEIEGQSEDSHHRSRRHNRIKENGVGAEPGLGGQEGPTIPKQARKKKKPKGSSGKGSSRSSSSRPRGSHGCSDPELDPRRPEMAPSLKSVDE